MESDNNVKKIFFSYVLDEEKQHLVTLFCEHLRKCGFAIRTSLYNSTETDKKGIEWCDLYVCFLTQTKKFINNNDFDEYKQICEQMRYVKYYGKPHFFVLMCDGTNFPSLYYSIFKDFKFLAFNSWNFDKAITALKNNNEDKIPQQIRAGIYAMMSLVCKNESEDKEPQYIKL